MFKKTDVIVCVSLLIVSVVLALALLNKQNGNKIKVTLDGKVFATYNLKENAEYVIKTEHGENTLIIKGNSAHFKNSNCPDKTCENMGEIKELGESIVCLPHRLVVEVVE